MSENAGYTPPEYRSDPLSGTPPWVPGCSVCGAFVANVFAHNEWHAALWLALNRTTP